MSKCSNSENLILTLNALARLRFWNWLLKHNIKLFNADAANRAISKKSC